MLSLQPKEVKNIENKESSKLKIKIASHSTRKKSRFCVCAFFWHHRPCHRHDAYTCTYVYIGDCCCFFHGLQSFSNRELNENQQLVDLCVCLSTFSTIIRSSHLHTVYIFKHTHVYAICTCCLFHFLFLGVLILSVCFHDRFLFAKNEIKSHACN